MNEIHAIKRNGSHPFVRSRRELSLQRQLICRKTFKECLLECSGMSGRARMFCQRQKRGITVRRRPRCRTGVECSAMALRCSEPPDFDCEGASEMIAAVLETRMISYRASPPAWYAVTQHWSTLCHRGRSEGAVCSKYDLTPSPPEIVSSTRDDAERAPESAFTTPRTSKITDGN